MEAFNKGQRNRNNRNGFTLVELMIVVVIMVILASAAVPLFNGYAQRAKDSKAIAECRQVVQASQVKAHDLYAAGLLEITQTNNSISKYGDEIKTLADVKGKIEDGPTVDESAQITFVMYECANGTRVRYDVTKNPKYAVETAEAPLTIIKDWTQSANNSIKDALSGKWLGYDRYKLYDELVKEGKIKELKVDKVIKDGTPFAETEMNWRPYYVGTKDNIWSVLYAVPSTAMDHNQWKANIVYVNGEVWVSSLKNGKVAQGANVANLDGCKTYEDVKKALLKSGFELKQ